jgi:hypothetical protein
VSVSHKICLPELCCNQYGENYVQSLIHRTFYQLRRTSGFVTSLSLKLIVFGLAFIAFPTTTEVSKLVAAEANHAAFCPPQGYSGGESIDAWATVDATGEPVADGAIVRPEKLRLDAVATAYGECQTYTSSCVPVATYYRTINHIRVGLNASTSSSLNGQYVAG